jgi:acyl-CoA thioesterase-1
VTVDPFLLEPFWLSATQRRESLFFVDPGNGVATATLLFDNVTDLSLSSSIGDVEFTAGKDYTFDPRNGIVRRAVGSRIAFATHDELYPSHEPFVLIGDDDEFHRRQTVATYRHQPADWRGYRPQLAVAELPRTLARLASSQPLTICVTGDSISAGYNASGFTGAPPRQPSYTELVADGLERASGSRVTLQNFSVAGWTSDDGVVDVSRVADARPDLAIVAYGMNDAGYAEAQAFAANIAKIMNGVRAISPGAEFVLVSPMLPNPRWDYPVGRRFGEYRDALAGLCGAGVALADLTTLWSDLLVRKSVHDLSGNGINHPNDFGHRLYAQVILALMVPASCGSSGPPGRRA